MRPGARTSNPYPHIQLRSVLGQLEAFLPGTGLSVWEITWLSRVYNGDKVAVADHLDIDIELIEEALQYANAHAEEIEPAVSIIEDASEERLRTILPGIRVIDMNTGPDDERNL